MQIDIMINGEKKTFVTPFVPMLARRKFLEIRAKEEKIFEKHKMIPAEKEIEIENELIHLMTDVVFNKQFTAEELMNGVDTEYFNKKLREAVFGIKDEEVTDGEEMGK